MQFRNQRTPRSYGRVQCLEEARLEIAARSFIRQHPSLGLLGLEIQAGIYSFLLQCAKTILHDIEPCHFLLAAYRPAPPPLETKKAEFRTLQDDALEVPYQAPQMMEIARLTQLVGARRSSAEDHIWMLMEDPAYFTNTLKEEREHSCEYDHDCLGAWRQAAARMTWDAFTYFVFWDDIYRRLK